MPEIIDVLRVVGSVGVLGVVMMFVTPGPMPSVEAVAVTETGGNTSEVGGSLGALDGASDIELDCAFWDTVEEVIDEVLRNCVGKAVLGSITLLVLFYQ